MTSRKDGNDRLPFLCYARPSVSGAQSDSTSPMRPVSTRSGMYDLKVLAAFSSVMTSGSLAASAQALGLSKSTLSRRIRQLEAAVGQPLLRREANQLIPTEAGELFHCYCRRILSLASEGQEALDELREDVSGTLTLQVHELFARGWFSDEAEKFMARHPRIHVVLRTQVALPDLPETNVLCLWLGCVPEGPLRQEVLGRLTYGVYAQPAYLQAHGRPRHPSDLADHAWVDLLGGIDGGLTLHHAREGEFRVAMPPWRMRVDQTVLHGDAIARGLGLGLLPHWMAEQRERAHPGTLELCLAEWQAPAQQISLLYPHGPLPRRTRAFIDHLRKVVPDAWKA